MKKQDWLNQFQAVNGRPATEAEVAQALATGASGAGATDGSSASGHTGIVPNCEATSSGDAGAPTKFGVT